ncbi:PqiC family protein [Methylomagnum sp.]
MRFQRLRPLGFVLILFLLGGCVGKSPPVEYFMLEPERHAASTPAGDEATGPVIAVGPIRIPEYLERSQIVTAKGGNAYKVDESHRWAERLDDNVSRVLVRNLEAMVPARQVLASSADRGQAVDFRVPLNILEFHIEPDGQALLIAQWSIRRDKDTLIGRTTSIRAAASTTDYGRMVSALNECLNGLSRTIANALRELPTGHSSR